MGESSDVSSHEIKRGAGAIVPKSMVLAHRETNRKETQYTLKHCATEKGRVRTAPVLVWTCAGERHVVGRGGGVRGDSGSL